MQDTQQSKRKQMTTTNNGKRERQPVITRVSLRAEHEQ